jgi:hypothetical protein
MLDPAQTQTFTPAAQRLFAPWPASRHSSLITASINRWRNKIKPHCGLLKIINSDPNESLVFVVYFVPIPAL